MSCATAAPAAQPNEAAAANDELVPLTRLDNSDPDLMRELFDAIRLVADRAAFTLGEEVEAFEAEFARFCAVDHVIGVSSGTEALALCLRALRLTPADEVIVPANSFIATAEAVTLSGPTPRFVDVDPVSGLVTAETIKPALNARVKAVIPVHLYGRTVDMNPILELAREHGLRVIEDAAQAHGAAYQGRRVGSLGDGGCFSFYPTKNLGGWGDGGAVTTNDAALADRVRLLRSHGERPRHCHNVIGTTARLDAIQAAILRIKLRGLDERNAARRRIARRFDRDLAGWLEIPTPPGPGQDHVYHQYVVRHDARDDLRRHLSHRGIASAVHYPVPIHQTPAYASQTQPHLAHAERSARTCCSLPMFPSMSSAELNQVVDACRSFAPAHPRTRNGR
jgi:dTDP-3-amino-3,4,6-trideoxy-alpha-D-glucose transaminase